MHVLVKRLGLTGYEQTWHAMQAFTATRTPETPDEIWLTEHPPIYTLGLNRKELRMPLRQDIPVIATDRGGKITYHGPGQAIIYVLVDLKRRGLQVRQLVSMMEQATIQLFVKHGLEAYSRADAPGVYVDGKKVASLGVRLKNRCSYHGLSINVDMDLSPFEAIDPCGYQGLQMTQLRNLSVPYNLEQTSEVVLQHLMQSLHAC